MITKVTTKPDATSFVTRDAMEKLLGNDSVKVAELVRRSMLPATDADAVEAQEFNSELFYDRQDVMDFRLTGGKPAAPTATVPSPAAPLVAPSAAPAVRPVPPVAPPAPAPAIPPALVGLTAREVDDKITMALGTVRRDMATLADGAQARLRMEAAEDRDGLGGDITAVRTDVTRGVSDLRNDMEVAKDDLLRQVEEVGQQVHDAHDNAVADAEATVLATGGPLRVAVNNDIAKATDGVKALLPKRMAVLWAVSVTGTVAALVALAMVFFFPGHSAPVDLTKFEQRLQQLEATKSAPIVVQATPAPQPAPTAPPVTQANPAPVAQQPPVQPVAPQQNGGSWVWQSAPTAPVTQVPAPSASQSAAPCELAVQTAEKVEKLEEFRDQARTSVGRLIGRVNGVEAEVASIKNQPAPKSTPAKAAKPSGRDKRKAELETYIESRRATIAFCKDVGDADGLKENELFLKRAEAELASLIGGP